MKLVCCSYRPEKRLSVIWRTLNCLCDHGFLFYLQFQFPVHVLPLASIVGSVDNQQVQHLIFLYDPACISRFFSTFVKNKLLATFVKGPVL
jgi:hypothetical protein